METLAEKLKAMGVNLGADGLKKTSPATKKTSFLDVIEGEEMVTPLGISYLITTDFPLDIPHGTITLKNQVEWSRLGRWAHINKATQEIPFEKIIFLDTETSGLSGGTGTFVFLLGFGYFTGTSFHLIQLFLPDPSLENAFIINLNRLLADSECLVTFNGKSFDIPILNTRQVLNGYSPIPVRNHVDLLHMARKLWRNRLPGRSMSDLERDILNFRRSGEEIPGWMVPQFYLDYLSSGDPHPLKGVLYHNAIDIVSLAALFIYIAEILQNPFASTSLPGLDIVSIAKLFEEMGEIDNSIKLYEKGLDSGLPLPFFIDTLKRYASIHKKNGTFENSVPMWEKAARLDDLESSIELSKYFEHHQADIERALDWAIFSQTILEKLPPGTKKNINLEEISRRISRLKTKQQRIDQG